MEPSNGPRYILGKIEPEALAPIPAPPLRTSYNVDAKQQRLLAAARNYRRQRSQKALDELLDAAKDIE